MPVPSTIQNRYHVISRLGAGDMSVVYFVRDVLSEGGPLALKVLPPGGDERLLRALEHEFSTLARIEHPNIASVRDFGFDPALGVHFFTYEYIDGPDILDAARSLSPAELLRILSELLRALHRLHSSGVVHYDIKPSNVLLKRTPEDTYVAKLIDFGLAGPAMDGSAGTLKGSLEYMAPEMRSGAASDGRTDLYSLGKTVLAVLEKMRTHSTEEDDVEDLIVSVAEKMAAEEPGDRFQSAWDALDALLAGKADEAGLAVLSPARLVGGDAEFEKLMRIFNRVIREPAGPKGAADVVKGSGPVGTGGRTRSPRRRAGTTAVLSAEATPLVLVAGVSGVGKRTLITRFKHSAQLGGVDVFTAEFAGAGNLARLLDALRGVCRVFEHVDAAAGKLLDDLESLGADDTAGGKQLPHEWERTRFFDRVVQHMITLSRKRPFVLVFSGIQWVDGATAEFFDYFIRRINSESAAWGGRVRILTVVSASTDELPEPAFRSLVGGLEEDGLCIRVEVRPLPNAESFELVQSMLGDVDLPRDVFDSMLRESGGVPLFLVEMLRSMQTDGLLACERGCWVYKGPPDGTPALPGGLGDLLMKKLEGLDTAARKTVDALSVFQSPVPVAFLEDMTGMSETELAVVLHDLLARQVLREESGRIGFITTRLHEMACNAVLLEDARLLHSLALDVLEKTGREGADFFSGMFFHARNAGLQDKALRFSLQAAAAYGRMGFAAKAIEYYTEARLLLGDSFSDAREAVLVTRRIAALQETLGRFGEALENCRNVVRSAAAVRLEAGETAQVYRIMGRSYERIGDYAGAMQSYERGLALLPEEGRSPECARLMASKSWVLLCRGRHSEALGVALGALKILAGADEGPDHAAVFRTMATIHERLGNFPQAYEFFERALIIFRAEDRTREVASTLNAFARAAIERADYNNALDFLRESFELASRTGDVYALAMMRALNASVSLKLGRNSDAHRHLAEAEKLAAGNRMRYLEAFVQLVGAALALDEGGLDEAARLVREARRRFIEMDDTSGLAKAGTLLTIIETERGDLAAASSAAESALKAAGELEGGTVVARALVAKAGTMLGSGRDRALAISLIEEALQVLADVDAPEVICAACYGLAETYFADGCTDRASEYYNRVREIYSKVASTLRPELQKSYRRTFERKFLPGGRRVVAVEEVKAGAETVLSLMDRLYHPLSVETFINDVLKTAVDATGASRAFFIMERGEGLVVAYSTQASGGSVDPDKLRISLSMAEKVLEEGRGLLLDDARTDERVGGLASVSSFDITGVLAHPVVVGDSMRGVLYLDAPGRTGVFNDADYRLTARLAHMIALAEVLDKGGKIANPSGDEGDFDFF